MSAAARSDGISLTRVGVFYVASTVVLTAAATNTGNNGLFLIVATMVAVFLVSAWMARVNVRGLELDLDELGELYANSPCHLRFQLRHRGRLLPRWMLLLTIDPKDVEPPVRSGRRRPTPCFVASLAPKEEIRGRLELMMRRRGLRRVRAVHVVSLFPLGLFRKGIHLRTDLEILIYPEIFGAALSRPAEAGRAGDEATRRPGWGHELYGLRDYHPGDDPRHMHWKQSARHGRLIFQQRQSEASQRLAIVFDNAIGSLKEEADRQRFERLVSEAATAALDFLDDGFEVSLVTRDVRVPFATGRRQRRNILEVLALVEAKPVESRALLAPAQATRSLELSMSEPEQPGRRDVA
ncbi:MAG: DUF58 domain-containing protein [Thermoanaerobaculia bacterium]|nr:DUF58 domain-containing protein [Thermoanaerobaculia bacterium]